MSEQPKRIHPQDARDALVDALTDLLHVHDGNEHAIGEFEYEAWKVARRHYANERGTVVIEAEELEPGRRGLPRAARPHVSRSLVEAAGRTAWKLIR